jgi:hypothetical protein
VSKFFEKDNLLFDKLRQKLVSSASGQDNTPQDAGRRKVSAKFVPLVITMHRLDHHSQILGQLLVHHTTMPRTTKFTGLRNNSLFSFLQAEKGPQMQRDVWSFQALYYRVFRAQADSFYRRNFLRKSSATYPEKCRCAAPDTEKSDKPAQ